MPPVRQFMLLLAAWGCGRGVVGIPQDYMQNALLQIRSNTQKVGRRDFAEELSVPASGSEAASTAAAQSSLTELGALHQQWPCSPFVAAGSSPWQCPPRRGNGSSDSFCGSLPAELGYTVHQLDSEAPLPGDCLVVTTIGLVEELPEVAKISNYIQSAWPQQRASCKRVRTLVFCKAFCAAQCNVTFDNNVGMECLPVLAAAGDSRLRPLIQDAMISAPAHSVSDPRRRARLRRIVEQTYMAPVPPFMSFADPGDYDEQFTIDEWKGPLVKAQPRPMGRWALEHLPNSSAELARKSLFLSEWSTGLFLASAGAIARHPPEAYLHLASTLRGMKPESCHYFERLWKYLFF